MSNEWKQFNAEQKSTYEDQCKVDKARYEKDKIAYTAKVKAEEALKPK